MGYCFLLLIFCVVGCLVEGKPKTLKNCGIGQVPQSRIIGGDPADHGEYPWMVSLHWNNYTGFKHLCGGAILNEHWVVTAAHCFLDPLDYEIYVGSHKLSDKISIPSKRYEISKIIIHENYNSSWLYNDIALIQTKDLIDVKGSGGFVNGICLPDKDEEPTGSAIVTGWGHTQESGVVSDMLNEVEVPLVSRNTCAIAYDDDPSVDEIIDSMICAGALNKDACQYDSGSPLMQKNAEGAYTMIGIVSHGYGCGRESYPGIYTKVSSFIDWLEQNMH